MEKTATILGIAGASGAGKSQVAMELFSRLVASPIGNDVRIIHEDSYYRDQSSIDFELRTRTNYDHPDAFEHELLVKHLHDVRAGKPIHVPNYDYSVHSRKTETELLEPCRILIIEGILVLHDPAIRDMLDIKVFVDVPLDICLVRRARRDTRLRSRSIESILKQFETTVRPMYFRYVEPTREHADIIVPRGGENEAAIRMLVDHVHALQH